MTTLTVDPDAETVIDLPYYDSYEKPAHFMNRPRLWMGLGTCYTNTKSISLESIFLSTSQIVKWMRDEGIPISTIADIMHVERKSIYAWLNGSACHDHNRERLEQVHSLLSENKIASLRNLYRFWSRKVLNNKSLAMFFHETPLDKHSIRMVLKELWPLAKKEQQKETRLNKHTTIINNPILRDSRVVIIEQQ